MGLELGPAHGPVLVAAARQVANEPPLILADEHVGVDERTAAQPGGHEAFDAPEVPQLEQALAAFARVPEVCPHVPGRAGERSRWVPLASLEEQNAPRV